MLILIIWPILHCCFSASISSNWLTTPDVFCDTLTLITTNTSSPNTIYTYPFTSSFLDAATNPIVPRSFLGVQNWEMAPSALNILNFNVQVMSTTSSQIKITTRLANGTTISSLKVGMMLQNNYTFTSIRLSYLSNAPNFTKLDSGSGPRWEIFEIDTTTTPIDTSHVNYMMPCLTSLFMKANGSSYFSLKVTVEIISKDSYYYNFSTDGNLIVYSANYFRIIYDKTAVQQTKLNYMDAVFMVATNNIIIQNVSFPFSSPNNFIAGMNAFNLSNDHPIQFNFQPTTLTLTTKYQYYHLNISCWNYRYRSCPTTHPYFFEEQLLCYDNCPQKYFANSTYNFCSPCHYTCLTCSNSNLDSCLSCDTTTALRNLNGSSYCVCKDGYFDKGNVNCAPCEKPCVTCESSNSTCKSCNTTGNMVLSGTSCVCVSNSALAASGTYCILCSTISKGCLNCSTTACTVCDSSLNYLRDGSVCGCVAGYFLNSTSQCQPCNTTINGCQTCKNSTFCTLCKTDFTLYNGTCSCTSGQFYDTTLSKCINCTAPCATCTNSSYCLSCLSDKSYVLVRGKCCEHLILSSDPNAVCGISACTTGYYNINGVCKQICGDGILFYLPCDDGNLQNGDGCDSSCQIQTNYTCINGSSTTPSLCSYNKPLDLALISSVKDITSNKVQFKISIGPALKVLDTFNFSQIISTNIDNAKVEFYYQKGTLAIKVSYSQSIQSKNVTVEVKPPTIFNNTFDMKVSNSRFSINPSNAEAYYYSNSVYDQAKIINIIYIICTSIALLLCGVVLRKIIGLELISMLQISFFSLALVDKLHPIYGLWGKNGYITNGYNHLPQHINSLFTYFQMPENIKTILYYPQFLQNINWMFLLQLIVFLLGILLIVIGKYTTKFIFRTGVFILKDFLMMICFFNTLNSSFSFGLQIHSLTLTNLFTSKELACDFIAILMCLCFNCLILFAYYKYTQMFQQELVLLKLNRASTIHPFVFCIFRFFLGFFMGLFNNGSFCIFVVFVLQLGYLIYVSVNQPFKHRYLMVRNILNQSSICFHLMTLIVCRYKLTAQYTSIYPAATGIIWIDLIVTVTATGCSLYCMIYNMCKSKSSTNKVENETNQTVQDIRVKDMIHTMQEIKEDAVDYEESVKSKTDCVKYDESQSKRKMMDPESDLQSKETEEI